MNYTDIRELMVYRGKPSVSLYIICNDRFGCMTKINMMCADAARQVREIYGPAGDALAKKLDSLHSRIPIEPSVSSLVLFVNEAIAWVYPLPYVVQDNLYVADYFVLDDIIHHYGRVLRYWVLILYHAKSFLFDGYEGRLTEVIHRHNLRTREERVDINDVAGRVCGSKVSLWGRNCRYETMHDFIRALDTELRHFVESDPLPLVCCGDYTSLEAFRTSSSFHDRVLAFIPLEQLCDAAELQVKVWPLVQRAYAHLQKDMLRNLQDACTANVCAQGMVAVWKAVHEGRAQFVCLERGYEPEICELPVSDTITFSSACHDGRKKNGIDALLEIVLSQGVPLCWYDRSVLSKYGHIAAIVSSSDQESPISS